MRERTTGLIRVMLWLLLICLGAPLTLRFLGLAFYAVAWGLDGAGLMLFLETAVELLPLGVCTAATVLTLWRPDGSVGDGLRGRSDLCRGADDAAPADLGGDAGAPRLVVLARQEGG